MVKNMNLLYLCIYLNLLLLLPGSILASEKHQTIAGITIRDVYQTHPNPANSAQTADSGIFHTILAADTLDTTIGGSVQADIDKLHEFATLVAQSSNMIHRSTVITGENLSKQVVIDTITKLLVSPQDIIYFHFSGHGKNLQTGSKWPALIMRKMQLVDFEWVIKTLKQKKPRLLIAMADACNDYPSSRSLNRSPGIEPIKHNKLFTNYQGYVIGSAASPGEMAQGKTDGGFLTLSLLESIQQESARTDVSPEWKSVTERASTKTRVLNTQQTPQFEVQVDKIPISSSSPLAIQLSKNSFRLGEQMQITVNSRDSGYIFIWDINSKGEAVLLFPNANSVPGANYIAPEVQILVPEPNRGYQVTINEPTGENLLVVALLKTNQQYLDAIGTYPQSTTEAKVNALTLWLQNRLGNNIQSITPVSYQTTN